MVSSTRSRYSSQSRLRSFGGLGKRLAFGIVAVLVAPAGAQVGETICACSPATIEFQLNFSLTCADADVGGDGVLATDCSVTPFQGGEVSTLVPVNVFSVDFLELDQNLEVLNQESSFVNFDDGAVFNFTSFSAGGGVNPITVPKTLIVSLIGRNVDREPLFMQYLITYSNACDAFPVLTAGEQIGWTRFVSCVRAKP